jgi:hypothetical protein
MVECHRRLMSVSLGQTLLGMATTWFVGLIGGNRSEGDVEQLLGGSRGRGLFSDGNIGLIGKGRVNSWL